MSQEFIVEVRRKSDQKTLFTTDFVCGRGEIQSLIYQHLPFENDEYIIQPEEDSNVRALLIALENKEDEIVAEVKQYMDKIQNTTLLLSAAANPDMASMYQEDIHDIKEEVVEDLFWDYSTAYHIGLMIDRAKDIATDIERTSPGEYETVVIWSY